MVGKYMEREGGSQKDNLEKFENLTCEVFRIYVCMQVGGWLGNVDLDQIVC